MTRADNEGFILVLLHLENLMELLKFVVNQGDGAKDDFLKVFKGQNKP